MQVTHLHFAPLPADLAQDLGQLGRQLQNDKVDALLVERIVARCGDLPLRRFGGAAGAIRTLTERVRTDMRSAPGPFGT